MFKQILEELREHAPFTIFGAVTAIIIMIIFRNIPAKVSYNIFYIFHPLHVLLSALVTAAMYKRHSFDKAKQKFYLLILLIIGYVGSIGIATLSDSIIPYIGEKLLGLPHRHIHLGFIEKWWLINPLAIIGIIIAYFKPATKVPHAGHVLISTWASLFHILMAAAGPVGFYSYVAIFIFLFLSVWLPCCVSDIVFPLLFVKKK
ncbi:MAG: hypothetical protein DRP74_02115 [Candidatus Omnitrophota bacterium]|nr:MAG: hypothetical protein DRP74_02115 [Candidatus Omnitrophota bacterium]